MPDNTLDNSFKELLDRQPTDKEVQKLFKVQKALNIKDNDALWSLLMVMEHYNTLYESIPQHILKVANESLSKVKNSADATAKASVEVANAELAKAVAEVAQKVADQTTKKQMYKWAAWCIGGAFVCLTLVASGMFFYGHKSGYELGLADSRNATNWASTPEGLRAYKFAQSGDMSAILNCSRKGWEQNKKVMGEKLCIPQSFAKDGKEMINGWAIP